MSGLSLLPPCMREGLDLVCLGEAGIFSCVFLLGNRGNSESTADLEAR